MTSWTAVVFALALVTQLAPPAARMVEILRPVLPYPSATPDGDLPEDHSAESRWFVVWPTTADDRRVIIRANPLHPEVQEASAKAMEEINRAVAAAERRAQASYDRALEQLRKTGKSTELESVTLDDEGVAGERIDAELEVTVDLTGLDSFDIATGEPPSVTPGTNGPSWVVTIPPNTYRPATGDDRREHFRAAETHLYFGLAEPPQVTRYGDEPRYRVEVPAGVTGNPFAVVIRGEAAMVTRLASTPDWSALSPR